MGAAKQGQREDQMPHTPFNALMAITLAVGAVIVFAQSADAQSRSSRDRNNPQVISKCMHDVQEAVPGSYEDTGISRTRTALYLSCVRNGGTIPR
jgi:hypothetical protein